MRHDAYQQVGGHILTYENNPRNIKAKVVRISARDYSDHGWSFWSFHA